MEQEQGVTGASADADRAVAASPSSPSVSPVPASIPSAGRIVGPELTSEADHFIVCGECGEALDCRGLLAVLHHETSGHTPKGRQ